MSSTATHHSFDLSQASSDQILKGKSILVTGAGDGIGRQAALTYASCGANVILLGRTVKKLEAVYDEITAQDGPQASIVPLDHEGATAQHYQGLADTIKGEYGKLDGLLSNASILGTLCPFTQIQEKDEYKNKHLRVNCINPGGTRTNMRAKAFPGEDPDTLKTPTDIMPSYVYLMADASKHENASVFDCQIK